VAETAGKKDGRGAKVSSGPGRTTVRCFGRREVQIHSRGKCQKTGTGSLEKTGEGRRKSYEHPGIETFNIVRLDACVLGLGALTPSSLSLGFYSLLGAMRQSDRLLQRSKCVLQEFLKCPCSIVFGAQ
jgi:hypothetical protein